MCAVYMHLSAALCSSERTRRVFVHPERRRVSLSHSPIRYINELNGERQKIFRSRSPTKRMEKPRPGPTKSKKEREPGLRFIAGGSGPLSAFALFRVEQVAAGPPSAVFTYAHWSEGNSLKISTCRWRCLISLCFRHFSAFCFAPGANGFRFTR